jgi:RimJ/RimL family protein N-acetyltransferase
VEAVTLEGRHVLLEPLAERHHEALCAVGLHPDLWAFTVARAMTPEEMQTYIRSALDAQAAGSQLPFVTIERASHRVVGSTRFMNIDPSNRRVEIGSTWVSGPWQRTPVNTEAKYLMLRHAFESWDYVRVELKTDALNQRSRAAIRRIGAVEEGVLRRHTVTWSGRIRDTVYYSILDSEWPRVKADLESKLTAK